MEEREKKKERVSRRRGEEYEGVEVEDMEEK